MTVDNCRLETQTMFVRLGPIVAVQFDVRLREMCDGYGGTSQINRNCHENVRREWGTKGLRRL